LPKTRLCLGGDNLFCYDRVLQICKDNGWSYVLVFKPTATPALSAEFEQLLTPCPNNHLQREAGGVRRIDTAI
jgi:hypothetical protein